MGNVFFSYLVDISGKFSFKLYEHANEQSKNHHLDNCVKNIINEYIILRHCNKQRLIVKTKNNIMTALPELNTQTLTRLPHHLS